MKNKKILVTGGSGFIGGHIVERLKKDNEIFVFDNFSKTSQYTQSKLQNAKNVHIVEGDVTNISDLESVVSKGTETIFHLASIAGINTVGKRPALTTTVNLIGTYNILELAKKHGVERVVYTSTSEVYGPNALNVSEEDLTSQGPVSISRWHYAISKLGAESLCHAYHKEYKVPITTLRYFNVYGPGQYGESAIKNFVSNAIQGKPIQINGGGRQIRAWCYIDDAVNGTLSAAEKEEAIGQIFNIGNPHTAITIYDLAREVIRLSGGKSNLQVIETEAVKNSDVYSRVPEIKKATAILGYEPKVMLEEGILRTIDFLKEEKISK